MVASLLLSASMLLLSACGQQGGSAPTTSPTPDASGSKKPIKIGVVQIVEHQALDAARDGFISEMAKQGYAKDKDVTYDLQSAQGNMDTATSIAQKFSGDKVDLILAIATPTAQAAAQTTKDIPVLFTAVTDPVAAGLVKSMDKPGGNLTGTTDMNPVEEQLSLIKEIKPETKSIGIIYNSGEVNSKVQIDMAKAVSGKLGITIQEAAITNPTEVKQAAESMIGKVDAFYVPTDNMVVSSLAAILKIAEEQKLPVIAGEENSVKSGAIATYGIDYTKLGEQTADMAVKVLKGEAKPADMAVEKQSKMKLTVNPAAAAKMGVTLPKAMLDRADEVIK
ncbi:ABC transporter substrate-binding protein [Brevibacillus ginsengisoli]|uniref:ABC transporter substrate-binding protein n=1 Tax=Brevibacillus ginsengisoli TaxID=363854 RepID=UPI003CF90B77